MPLCTLCAGIPWEDLSPLPSEWTPCLTGHKHIHDFRTATKPLKNGYTHYQSFDALAASAREMNCDLCKLILHSAQNVKQELESLKPRWEAGTTLKFSSPLWELWVVKRRDGGPGIWVMSEVEDPKPRNSQVYIIAAIGLCARDGDPLASIFSGRPIEEQPGSEIAIGRARDWLFECNKHPNCTFRAARLPSRVLDVGDDSKSPYVRLHESDGQQHEKYVTLSYCWGTSTKFTTTKANLESRKQGIVISEMPQTHQNAITMTRELGVRYLWIDSLCICQDDKVNWERESANMLHTYANSYLTIGAFGAEGSSEGFFRPRPVPEYAEFDYTHSGPERVSGRVLAFNLPLREEAIPFDYAALPREPLSDRAWGLQERILSRRKLLYGTTQMYFECFEGFRGENGLYLDDLYHNMNLQVVDASMPKDEVHYAKLSFPAKPRRTSLKHRNLVTEKDMLRDQWKGLLCTYGFRKLTKPSDKLPALSGIASIFANWMQDEYVAGLWKSDLLNGLMWQGLRARRVAEYRAPSWSWASIDGIAATTSHIIKTPIATVVDCKVDLKGLNPYGEVTSGWIKIRAPLEKLFFLEDFDPTKPGYPYDINPMVRTALGDPKGAHTRFDFAFTHSDALQQIQKILKDLEGVEIFALVLLYTTGSEEETFHCLIVRRVDGGEEMQRLGFILLGGRTLGKKLADLEETMQDITLI